MRFLIDQNLPIGLAAELEAMGHQAEHVKPIGLSQTPDAALWARAVETGAVMISKDADFLSPARRGPSGALLWLAVGNCANDFLYALVRRRLAEAVQRLQDGERIVETRP